MFSGNPSASQSFSKLALKLLLGLLFLPFLPFILLLVFCSGSQIRSITERITFYTILPEDEESDPDGELISPSGKAVANFLNELVGGSPPESDLDEETWYFFALQEKCIFDCCIHQSDNLVFLTIETSLGSGEYPINAKNSRVALVMKGRGVKGHARPSFLRKEHAAFVNFITERLRKDTRFSKIELAPKPPERRSWYWPPGSGN